MLNGTGPAQDRHQARNGAGPAWYSVPAAAVLLGIHERAVRKRIAAGKIIAERTAAGWRVQLAATPGPELGPERAGPRAGTTEPSTGPGPEPAAPLVDQLQGEVLFLRGQVEALQERLREAHVLLAQRPALPVPLETVSDKLSETAINADLPPRPWWARWWWWRR